MSKNGIYRQLTSEIDKFSEEDAQYAVDHLKADYKENALKTAKNYRNTLNMSTGAIYNQLISDAGNKFTEEEAQYAIDHLDK
ncbi:Ltp family lipoprotein [Staphylococcus auricularis]|uniref:Ltp family lipoprotein n=1 Tax=Staphylococcus auricularis TaxID=29379 RepID=UPI003EBF5851